MIIYLLIGLVLRQIGEVVDGPGGLDDKRTLNGKQYDYGIHLVFL
jgi:hypothetical protein